MNDESRILERIMDFNTKLVEIDVLLKNHLEHHRRFTWLLIFPIATGIVILVAEKILVYLPKFFGG